VPEILNDIAHLSVTSLKLLDCKNGGLQKLAMNLCAHKIK
jgi:hypothetical protein